MTTNDPSPPAAKADVALPAAIDTRQLFGSTNEILIRHEDAVYRLRITRAGKLILTK